jgi:hypothetical protein
VNIKRSTAVVLGFIVAPIVPVIVLCAINPPTAQNFGMYLAIAAIVYVNACFFMLVLGTPTYLLFKRWGLMHWWTIMPAGFVVGAWVGYVYRLPFYPSPFQSGFVQGAACGVAGFVFWLIWRMGTDSAPQLHGTSSNSHRGT